MVSNRTNGNPERVAWIRRLSSLATQRLGPQAKIIAACVGFVLFLVLCGFGLYFSLVNTNLHMLSSVDRQAKYTADCVSCTSLGSTVVADTSLNTADSSSLGFLTQLFDTSDFTPRWQCGKWTTALGWLHILSDLGVWLAYLAIPCVLIGFAPAPTGDAFSVHLFSIRRLHPRLWQHSSHGGSHFLVACLSPGWTTQVGNRAGVVGYRNRAHPYYSQVVELTKRPRI